MIVIESDDCSSYSHINFEKKVDVTICGEDVVVKFLHIISGRMLKVFDVFTRRWIKCSQWVDLNML